MRHTASSGDHAYGLAEALRVERRHVLRIPPIELTIAWLFRRRFGFYDYDLKLLRDFWLGGPLALPPRFQHFLLAGPWAFVLTASFIAQFVAAGLGRLIEIDGLDQGYPWTYVYSLAPLALAYHLVCAMLAGRRPASPGWRWTSSLPVEVALLVTAGVLAALP